MVYIYIHRFVYIRKGLLRRPPEQKVQRAEVVAGESGRRGGLTGFGGRARATASAVGSGSTPNAAHVRLSRASVFLIRNSEPYIYALLATLFLSLSLAISLTLSLFLFPSLCPSISPSLSVTRPSPTQSIAAAEADPAGGTPGVFALLTWPERVAALGSRVAIGFRNAPTVAGPHARVQAAARFATRRIK